MPDEVKDAKETATTEVDEIAAGGSSTSDHPEVSRDSENVFSTVEGETPGPSPSKDDKPTDVKDTETAKTTAEELPAEKVVAEEAAAEAAKAKGDSARYDKDPYWQRIIQERDEARERAARIEGQLEGMKTAVPQREQETKPTYVDITTKTDDELREWQNDDPKGYAANFYSQVRHELLKEHEQADQSSQAKASVKKTFDDYSAKNSDFMPMWKSGDIQKFMNDNPGHNAISAHIMLTAEKSKGETEKQLNARIAKEVKAAEEKVVKNFQAKKTASKVLSGAATVVNPLEDGELKDTKSRGGVVSVIADRLKKMRGASA